MLVQTEEWERGGIMVQTTSEVDLIGELEYKIDESLLIHVKKEIEDLILLMVYNPPRSDKLVLITG